MRSDFVAPGQTDVTMASTSPLLFLVRPASSLATSCAKIFVRGPWSDQSKLLAPFRRGVDGEEQVAAVRARVGDVFLFDPAVGFRGDDDEVRRVSLGALGRLQLREQEQTEECRAHHVDLQHRLETFGGKGVFFRHGARV